ncbi:MAG: hypothetical protein JXR86_09415 [Spirochaetales bacterium]|nr:hypothetical protein [Spirochaetales bacterium]
MANQTHGDFVLQRYEDIIYLKLSGSTNLELFKELQTGLRRFDREMEGHEWALVVDFTDWNLAPPDFFQAALQHDRDTKNNSSRPKLQIIISHSFLQNNILQNMNRESDVHMERLFLSSIDEARSELKKIGYSGELPNY